MRLHEGTLSVAGSKLPADTTLEALRSGKVMFPNGAQVSAALGRTKALRRVLQRPTKPLI